MVTLPLPASTAHNASHNSAIAIAPVVCQARFPPYRSAIQFHAHTRQTAAKATAAPLEPDSTSVGHATRASHHRREARAPTMTSVAVSPAKFGLRNVPAGMNDPSAHAMTGDRAIASPNPI